MKCAEVLMRTIKALVAFGTSTGKASEQGLARSVAV